jgi:AcrR family transcriptional regulator
VSTPQVRKRSSADIKRQLLAQAARREGRGGGRDRIVAAATRLFGTRGYSDVSMQDVARAAHVTKAALYYHFADKQDLYTTVSMQRIADISMAMEAAVAEGTLEERLLRLALVGFERMQSDIYAPHLHAHEHLDAAHHLRLHEAMDRLQEPIVRCFAEAGPRDAALSPRAATELLVGIMFSLIFVRETSEATPGSLPVDRTERANLAIRLFLGGYWSLASGEAAAPG